MGYGLASCFVERGDGGRRIVFHVASLGCVLAISLLFVSSTLDFYFKTNIFNLVSILSLFLISVIFIIKHLYRLKNPVEVLNNLIPLFATVIFGYMFYIWLYGNSEFFTHGLAPDFAAYIASAGEVQGYKEGKFLEDPFSVEILLRAHRIGLVSLIGFLKSYTSIGLVDLIISIVFSFYFSGLVLFTTTFLKHLNIYNVYLFLFTALLLVFNANLLQILNEGFLPQAIGSILFSLMIAFDLKSRKLLTEGAITFKGGSIAKKVWKNNFLLIIFMSSLFCNYSEFYVLFIAYLLGMAFFEILLRDKYTSLKMKNSLLFFLLSGVLISPQIIKVIKFTIANSGNFRNIGYPFPGYLTFTDMIGATNIFSESRKYLDTDLATRIVEDSFYPLPLKVILSFVLVYLILRTIREKDQNLQHAFYVALAGVVSSLLINILFHYKYQAVENYVFNKIALSFSLFVTVLTVLVINTLKAKKKVFASLVVASLISFSLFAYDRTKYRNFVPKDVISMKKVIKSIPSGYYFLFNKRGYRKGKIVGRLRYIDRTNEFILSGLLGITGKSIDQWNIPHLKGLREGSKLAYLVKKDLLLDQEIFKSENKRLVSLGNDYYLLKTDITLDKVSSSADPYSELSKYFLR